MPLRLPAQGLRAFKGPLAVLDLRWTNVKNAGAVSLWRALWKNTHKELTDVDIRGIPPADVLTPGGM